jgi:hypothetical protein
MSTNRPINEKMSIQQAGNILRRVGIDTRSLDDSVLRKVLQGKDAQTAQVISAAYKLFRSPQEPSGIGAPGQQQTRWAQEKDSKRPVWAVGNGDWRINREDFTDPNFVRMKLWELSGKPNGNPITIWSFNDDSFNFHLQVLAKVSVMKEIVKATLALTKDRTKAIFLAGQTNKMLLVFLDGRILHKPIPFSHRSSNSNPANDWGFIGELPRMLADLNHKFENGTDEQAGDYKAWINVETNKVVPFEADKNYYDMMRSDPKTFGVHGTKSSIQARIAAERAGWVASGINVGEDGKAVAIVTGMTPEHALKAARILFKTTMKKHVWDSLKVKTNDGSIVCSNRNEIRQYLMTGHLKATHDID